MLMTALEEQLKQDATGHYRLQLTDRLHTEKTRVVRVLNRGCRPDEFARQEALKAALEAAQQIIDQLAARLK